MTDRPDDDAARDWFTLDAAYFRDQAREAMRIFVAPLAASYHAITPPSTNADARDVRVEK